MRSAAHNGRVLRLGIVDDHPVARRGLAAIMAEDGGLEVVAGLAAPADLPEPALLDVVLCDLYLSDGLPAVAAVRELARVTRVLMVSAGCRPADVLACVAAGAGGYVTKDSGESVLREAVRQVAAGEFYVSPQLAGIVGSAARGVAAAGDASPLTPREEEALGWISRGYTHAQTARRMGVTTATVDTYIKRIRARLHLGNKAELAWFARNMADAAGPPAPQGGARADGPDAGG